MFGGLLKVFKSAIQSFPKLFKKINIEKVIEHAPDAIDLVNRTRDSFQKGTDIENLNEIKKKISDIEDGIKLMQEDIKSNYNNILEKYEKMKEDLTITSNQLKQVADNLR